MHVWTVKGDPGSKEELINATAICAYNRCFSSQSLREYYIMDVVDKFAIVGKCSLSELRKSSCGPWFVIRRSRITGMQDDITGHLLSCHLSKPEHTYGLILIRARKFDLPTHH